MQLSVRFLKPDAVESFDGALCDKGWILLWSDRRACAWSADRGWLMLPEAPGKIEGARGARGGVVVAGDGDIGFWVHGESQWRWWTQFPPAKGQRARAMSVSGVVLPDLLVMHAVLMPSNKLWIYGLDAEKPEILATIVDDGPQRLLHAWNDDASPGDVCLLFENGLYAARAPLREARLELVRQRSGDGELFSFGRDVERFQGRVVAHRMSEPAEILDLDTWTKEPLPLGRPPIHPVLWPAYFAGDRALVTQVLDLVEDASAEEAPGGQWGQHPLACLLVAGEPVALASSAGVLPAAAVPATEPARRRSSWCRSDDDYLSWRLWASGREALPEACTRLVETTLGPELLARAVSAAGGPDACAMVLESSRGKPFPFPSGWRFDGIRFLYSCHPEAGRAAVLAALNDSDPLVVALGCAGCAADGLWSPSASDLPMSGLLAGLAAATAGVRATAADSCGRLRLRPAVDPIGALLTDAEEAVRRDALSALVAIGELDTQWILAIERMALEDPENDLRQSAVEALGRFTRGSATLDVLVQAMADGHWSVRSRAVDAVEPQAERLSVEQFWRFADTVLALLAVARRADDPTDFSLGIDRALLAVASRLEETYFQDDPPDLTNVPPPAVEVYFLSTVLLLALLPALVPGARGADSRITPEDLQEGVVALGKGNVFTRAQLGELARPEAVTAGTLARLSAHAATAEPELSARLAILAVLSSPADSPHGRARAEGRCGALHERLRLAAGQRSPLERCLEVVKRQSGANGFRGALALLSLAFRGDAQARGELTRRVLEWEIRDCPAVFACHFETLPPAERADFASRFISSAAVPLAVRAELARRWDAAKGALAETALKTLWRELTASESLDIWHRADAARELANHGEPGPLEGLWLDARARGLLTTDPLRYQCACDLARVGHAEALDGVRGLWLDRGDVGGLVAFATVGTLQDIPELEAGIERGVPAEAVRGAIDAIRKRCAS